MKADLSKLGVEPQVVTPAKSPEKKPGNGRGKLIGACAAFAACLAVLGTGMVYKGMSSGDSAFAEILYDTSESNPSYTVQYMAYVTSYDIKPGDEGMKVIKGDGGWCIPMENDGTLSTVRECVGIYADYKTDWSGNSSVGSLSLRDDGYRLSQIWFGQDGLSKDESDFTIIDAPDDLSKVVLTNNPDNPALSKTGNGRYLADAEGGYTVCVDNGDVIRLIYEPVESWATNSVDVFDYDVTDGGYYLKADYEKRGDIAETSGQAEEEGLIYVDTGLNGIHSSFGEGARFAFGGSSIGTGLGDESVNGLDTINVKNYSDADGIVRGLVSGIDGNGDVTWADGIAGIRLFGGKTDGRTDYTGGKYKFTFRKSGGTKTLSAVESEYGTMAEGLDGKEDTFWILDGSPSSGTDGHDPLWGSSDGLVYYYREGGEPEMLKTSDDGKDHDSFFGFRYTEDFTLYPGYTGPLSFFGYSDDDMWVFVARVDENGRMIEGTDVEVIDLGGTHGGVGAYADLWDVIGKVPYGEEAQEWRLYVYWLERDGSSAACRMSYSLPMELSISPKRTTQAVIEAVEYTREQGGPRTFVFDDRTHDRFPAILNGERDMTVTSGEEFTIPGGSMVEIQGLTDGQSFTVRETNVSHSWHSAEGGYAEGAADKVAGVDKWTAFVSAKNEGLMTVSIDADNGPSGGFPVILTLEGMADTEISAMDKSNRPLGVRPTDKDGKLEFTLSAGEAMTLYNLPDVPFTLEPKAMAGWHVAEVILDGGDVDGSTVRGILPAVVTYRYEKNKHIPVEVGLEQSVSGSYGTSDITLGNGALLSYRITVRNQNDVDVDVNVHDWLPEGLTAVTSTVTESGGTADGSALSWSFTIGAHSGKVIEFTCEVNAESGTTLSNTVRVASGGTESDSNIVTAEVP